MNSLSMSWRIYFFKIFSPRFELPASDASSKDQKKLVIICHFCGDTGHKAMYCHKMGPDPNDPNNVSNLQKMNDCL